MFDAVSLKALSLLTPEECAEVLTIRNEPGVRDRMYTNHLISASEHQGWIDRLATSKRDAFYAVFLSKRLIGGIGLSQIDTQNRRADWGFYLTSTLQKQGVDSVMFFKFLDLVFDEFDLFKLNAEVMTSNTAGLAIHRKFGFQDEGVRRAQIWRGDRPHDMVLLGLTAPEWAVKRQHLAASVRGEA